MEQIKPFAPTFHLSEMVETRREDRRSAVPRHHRCAARCSRPRSMVIAAGGGSFQPKRPPIPGIEAYEGKSVLLRGAPDGGVPRQAAADRRRRRLGARLDAQPRAAREPSHAAAPAREFRAAPDSVNKMMALVGEGKIDFVLGQVTALEGETGSSARHREAQRRLEFRDRLRRHPAVLRADHEARPGRQLGHRARRRT